jgi:uncharacterized protein YggT (Ycf19 family)
LEAAIMANAIEQKKDLKIPGYLRFSKVIVWFLYFYVLLGVVSLVFRIFLLAFSADSTAGFYKLVFNVSNDYLQPFRGIFPTKPVGETGYLDISSLFAILVYLLIIWGLHSLINYVQDKIDITKATQEKELAEIKKQKELAEQKANRAVNTKTSNYKNRK